MTVRFCRNQPNGCRGFVSGKVQYCPECQNERAKEYNRRQKAKRVLAPLTTNGHYPPLAETEFPLFSRGWFKAQLAAGLSPEAMAFGSRSELSYIREELKYMPRGAA